MARTISRKSLVKDSEAKPLGKSPTGGKTLGLDPETRFYEL